MEISTASTMPTVNMNLHNVEIDQLIHEFSLIAISVSDSHSEKIERKNNKIYISEKIKKKWNILFLE